MSSVLGLFMSCTLTYGLKSKINDDRSTPYFIVENADRRLADFIYIYAHNENFRVPSAHRQIPIMTRDGKNSRCFYVNCEDLMERSPGLFKRLPNVWRCRRTGRITSFGAVKISAEEFEMLLRLIFDSYTREERHNILEKHLDQMVVLTYRFRISSLVEECRQLLLNTNNRIDESTSNSK